MKDEPEMIIPADRLPPGFAERLAEPPEHAAPPRAAATVVLVRDGQYAPEMLLLKRHGSAGFVPGAYVFPGGRIDDADTDARLVRMLSDLPEDPAAGYWLGGIRELFEETGVLLARRADATPAGDAVRDAALAELREALLTDRTTLLEVLTSLEAVPDISRMVYCAHWITPVAEPKRYDTRFFIAELPHGCETAADKREMVDAVWVNAADAIEGFQAGRLPMVFPTIKTIQRLVGYRSVDDMIDAFRGAAVPPVLPRLVRTRDGVGIVVDDEAEQEQE